MQWGILLAATKTVLVFINISWLPFVHITTYRGAPLFENTRLYTVKNGDHPVYIPMSQKFYKWALPSSVYVGATNQNRFKGMQRLTGQWELGPLPGVPSQSSPVPQTSSRYSRQGNLLFKQIRSTKNNWKLVSTGTFSEYVNKLVTSKLNYVYTLARK